MAEQATDIWRAGIESFCGKCGYCVHGLKSCICPECGSDLREVGILARRGQRWEIRRIIPFVVWTLILCAAAIGTSYPLFRFFLPSEHFRMIRREIICRYPRMNVTLEVIQSGTTWVQGMDQLTSVPPDSMNIHLQGRLARMWVDLIPAGNGTCWIDNGSGPPTPMGRRWDQGALQAYFSQMGLKASDRGVQEATALITVVITEWLIQPQSVSQMGSGWRFANGSVPRISLRPAMVGDKHFFPLWIWGLVAAVWMGIWLLGIFIVWRSERNRAQPQRQPVGRK